MTSPRFWQWSYVFGREEREGGRAQLRWEGGGKTAAVELCESDRDQVFVLY